MRYTKLVRGLVVAVLMLSAASAFSQPQEYASSVPALVKSVVFDPTTYLPAIVAWESTRLDWRTSQVFARVEIFRLPWSHVRGDAQCRRAAANRWWRARAPAAWPFRRPRQ